VLSLVGSPDQRQHDADGPPYREFDDECVMIRKGIFYSLLEEG
jgi:hypothetical protein